MRARLRQTLVVASTASLAVAAGSAAAIITFAVVNVVGSGPSRPDLGGPVVVEVPVDPSPTPEGDDEAEPSADEN